MSRYVTHRESAVNSIMSDHSEHLLHVISQESVPKAMSLQEVIEATSLDKSLQFVMSAIHTGKWDSIAGYSNDSLDWEVIQCFMKIKDELSSIDGKVVDSNFNTEQSN